MLVALHAVDWHANHEFLLDGDTANGLIEPHVEALVDWYRWSAAEREFPITDAAVDYLERRVATVDCGPPVLLWGDPRVGNMIFAEDHRVAAALDFETAMIGPAARDVAHWLFFDDFQTEAVGIERLPGWPDRATTIARYEALLWSPARQPRVLRRDGIAVHGHDAHPPGRRPGRQGPGRIRHPYGPRQHRDPDAGSHTRTVRS